MKLVVLGHIAYDYIFDIPYHPSAGYSIYITNYTRHYGGGGANICYGLSKLGVKCVLVSSMGRDSKRYGKYLLKNGIELHVYRSRERLARAFIFNAGEKQISYFYWGASKDMDKIKAIKSDYLHIAPSHPKAAIEMAAMAKFFAFEPGQDIPRYSREDLLYLIEGANIIFCNEFELKQLEKVANLKGKKVIITLGKKGCRIYGSKIIPAKKARVVDTTGAGDAFKAAFWAGFLNGYEIEKCCRLGNIAASYVVGKRGAQHMTTMEKLLEEL